jgi:hypothetical protein
MQRNGQRTQRFGIEVMLQTYILEVFGSNIGKAIGYPDRDYSLFYSSHFRNILK